MDKELKEVKKDRGILRHEGPILFTIFFVSVLLRLYRLGTSSLRIDEVSTAFISRTSLATIFAYWGGLPVLFLKTKLFTLWSLSPVAVRLPSVLEGVAGVLAVYYLGRHLFQRESGLLAAALMAVSPMAVYYSQDARYYALLMTMSAVATIFLIRALEDGGRWWLLFWAATTVNFFNHTSAWLVLGGHVFFALWWVVPEGRGDEHPVRSLFRRLRPLAVSAALTTALYMSIFLPRLLSMEGGEWWVRKFDISIDPGKALTVGQLGGNIFGEILSYFGGAGFWWVNLILGLAFLAVCLSGWRALGLFLSLMVLPLAAMTLHGLRKLEIRYLVFMFPVFVIFLGHGWFLLVDLVTAGRSQRLRTILLAAFLPLILLVNWGGLKTYYQTPKQSMKEAALLLGSRAGEDILVMVPGPRQAEGLLYYLNREKGPELTMATLEERFNDRGVNYALDVDRGTLRLIERPEIRAWRAERGPVWKLTLKVDSLVDREKFGQYAIWSERSGIFVVPFYGLKSSLQWVVSEPGSMADQRTKRWRDLVATGLELAHDDQGLHILEGQFRLVDGDVEGEAGEFRLASRIDGRRPPGHMASGFLGALEEETDEAYREYRAAHQAGPGDLHAYLGMKGRALVKEASPLLFPRGAWEEGGGNR